MLGLPQLFLKISSSTAIIVVTVYYLWRRLPWTNSYRELADDKPPDNWVKVGEVTGLTIFPLKSAKGRALQTAEFSSLGLCDTSNSYIHLSDREFIIYDMIKKTAVSGLVKSHIVLMDVIPVSEFSIKLSFPGEPDCLLQIPVETSNVVEITRWWGETVQAVDCGDDVARWVSQCLLQTTTGLRVGHFSRPKVPLRTVDKGWERFVKVYPKLCSQYLGAYSYMASYLLITEESVAEVNSRLNNPVSELQFRANVTVKGAPAFMEDSWDWIKFGEQAILRNFKPCTRCAVTAINLETGKLDPDLEPLRTLKTFRQLRSSEERELSGSEPMFGIYAGLYKTGAVSLGDPVYVTYR